MQVQMQKLKPFIAAIGVWIVLLVLTYAFSRDIFAYHCWFDDALALPPANRFFGLNGYIRDPAYYLLQAFGSMFLPFEVFFAILILAALVIKLFALLQLSTKPSLLEALPYILVLSFLHEGTQVRVALALSFALWAIIWFAQGKLTQAFLILCVAVTFHLSVIPFFLIFLLLILYDRLGFWIFPVIAFISAFLAYSSVVSDLVITWGEATHARYMAYSVGDIYLRQNSSGLFQYFSFFVVMLTILVWRLHQPNTKTWRELKKIALISGFLAIIFLQLFRFNVVIASRLADLLLLPLTLVLGSALVGLKQNHKKKLFWMVMILLVGYCCVRSLVTYHPDPNSATVCHPELQTDYIQKSQEN